MRRLVLATLCVLGAISCSTTPQTDATAGANANKTAEWTMHGGDNNEQRYSPLKQVNADNVAQLGLAWYADMAERGQWQTTPLMVDGRLYVTTPWSKLYAFDAATGKQLWKYDPQVPRELAAVSLCCNNSNRGGVFWKGKIIWGTLDGRLVAVDAVKGTKVWEAQTTNPKDAMSITGAPRIGNGMVFIGQGGGEYHQRGLPVRLGRRDGQVPVEDLRRPRGPIQRSGRCGLRQRDADGRKGPGTANGGRKVAAARRGTASSTTRKRTS